MENSFYKELGSTASLLYLRCSEECIGWKGLSLASVMMTAMYLKAFCKTITAWEAKHRKLGLVVVQEQDERYTDYIKRLCRRFNISISSEDELALRELINLEKIMTERDPEYIDPITVTKEYATSEESWLDFPSHPSS